MPSPSAGTNDPYYHKAITADVEKFGDEYIALVKARSRRSALVPSAHKFFICPVGVVGSGKTTTLTLLERELDFVRVSGDEIRELLHKHDADAKLAWQIGAYAVDYFTQQGLNIAHDTDGATQATRENIAALAAAHGYQTFWIHVTAPEVFIINKLRNHEPSYLFRNADEAIARYRERLALHRTLPPLDFIATIDTSRADLDAQASKAARLIRAKISE